MDPEEAFKKICDALEIETPPKELASGLFLELQERRKDTLFNCLIYVSYLSAWKKELEKSPNPDPDRVKKFFADYAAFASALRPKLDALSEKLSAYAPKEKKRAPGRRSKKA